MDNAAAKIEVFPVDDTLAASLNPNETPPEKTDPELVDAVGFTSLVLAALPKLNELGVEPKENAFLTLSDAVDGEFPNEMTEAGLLTG